MAFNRIMSAERVPRGCQRLAVAGPRDVVGLARGEVRELFGRPTGQGLSPHVLHTAALHRIVHCAPVRSPNFLVQPGTYHSVKGVNGGSPMNRRYEDLYAGSQGLHVQRIEQKTLAVRRSDNRSTASLGNFSCSEFPPLMDIRNWAAGGSGL